MMFTRILKCQECHAEIDYTNSEAILKHADIHGNKAGNKHSMALGWLQALARQGYIFSYNQFNYMLSDNLVHRVVFHYSCEMDYTIVLFYEKESIFNFVERKLKDNSLFNATTSKVKRYAELDKYTRQLGYGADYFVLE